ncbi:hypothetical protein OS493_038404 [Desmophyllum pertusum]|uniref:Uncharacterized protein n=1 Tax=Desmophyllum pertusum TaxID=174260 RepID=A0A9W9YHH4_9CNID|nr:hypothetical protein OS493_038404 [Desmophyllum pertusum]
MEKERVNLDNLMSFSSDEDEDEQDNAAINSEVSWLTVLASELNAARSNRSGTESTRSLSPNFCVDGHQSNSGRNSSKNINHEIQGETRVTHSSPASGGDHLKWIDFSSDSDSLFNQESRLRASHSCDELSPPRSPVKKPEKFGTHPPPFPHGGFSNYHKLFRPLQNYWTFKVQQLAMAKREFKMRSVHTLTLLVFISKGFPGELSRKGSKEEILSTETLPKDTYVFPMEMTKSADMFKTYSKDSRPLKVKFPNEEVGERSNLSQMESVARRKSMPPARPPPPKISQRPISSRSRKEIAMCINVETQY